MCLCAGQRESERERRGYAPHEENNLGAVSIGAGIVVELQDGITAVISGELSEEVSVAGRGVSSLKEGDGLVVSGETQDHVAVLAAELEVVELRHDGLVNSNSGGLSKFSNGLERVPRPRKRGDKMAIRSDLLLVAFLLADQRERRLIPMQRTIKSIAIESCRRLRWSSGVESKTRDWKERRESKMRPSQTQELHFCGFHLGHRASSMLASDVPTRVQRREAYHIV